MTHSAGECELTEPSMCPELIASLTFMWKAETLGFIAFLLGLYWQEQGIVFQKLHGQPWCARGWTGD